MKTIFLFAVTFLSANAVMAQHVSKTAIPDVVQKSQSIHYPDVKSVKWEKEHGNYEASFEINGTEMSVIYDPNGNMLETETEIELNALPISVFDYLKVHYKGKKIKEASKLTDAKGVTTYEAEIKGMDLMFDCEGRFLKEVKE